MNNILFVGSWLNAERKNGGIHLFEHDTETQRLVHLESYLDNISAGAICLSKDKKFLYAVDEVKHSNNYPFFGGTVYAFSIDRDSGKLEYLNSIATCGVFPNYITIDSSGKYLLITNYGSEDFLVHSTKTNGDVKLEKIYDEANVVSISINGDGSLGKIAAIYRHNNKPSLAYERLQSSPHPHSVNLSPSGSFALVTDRGCDQLVFYKLNKTNGSLDHIADIDIQKKYGPRNSVFHTEKPFFYIACELLPFVISYSFDENCNVKQINAVPTVPEERIDCNLTDFYLCPHPAAIRIHPNGKFLYTTTRGENSIELFTINQDDGSLSFVERYDSGGIGPRVCSFNATGDFLYAANYNSNNLTVFFVDRETGRLNESPITVNIERAAAIEGFSG